MLARLATPLECAALAELESHHETAAGWGVSGFESEFKQKSCLMLAAVENGVLCGFICARILVPELQILNMACAAPFQRYGVASLLLKDLFSRARTAGCTRATLEVRSSNAAALGCYRKAGFQIVGHRPKFYNGTEDAVLMDALLK